MADVARASEQVSVGPAGAATSPDRQAEEERHRTERGTVSVLVPVEERPADLAELYRAYSEPLAAEGWDFEFVFALEPYHAHRADALEALVRRGEPIEILEAGQAVGEASLIRWAMEQTRGDVVVTLPAYYRVEPETLPRLVRTVRDGDADLAVARRRPRRDSWVNRLQARVFHALLRRTSGTKIDDLGCGVRAARRQVLEDVPLYGDFFRFFPLLADSQGFRLEQVDGAQHPRDRAPRVYAPGVYLRRLIDLLGVYFLVRFTYKPLRFFGLVGSGVSLGGLAILGVLFVQRLGGQGIADRPLLLLGVLLVTLGVQAVALGLIGEIIVHLNAPEQRGYRVLEVTEQPE